MKKVQIYLLILLMVFVIASCQKLDRPPLPTNYPTDNPVTPTTPLRFYLNFDSTAAADKQINIRFKDSISNYPCFFPDPAIAVIAGVHGTAYGGTKDTYIHYINVNDFASTASSFSISFWEKRNGAPQGNASFAFHLASSNGYWTGGTAMFCLFDWGTVNDSAIIKVDVVDAKMNDNWFQWTGAQRIKGIMDNQWHHVVFVYDANTSIMTLYADGAANPNTQSWGTHGAVNLDASKIAGLDIGGNRHVKDMGWGMQWDGGLDQFRMYSKALSASEVLALYNGKM